MKFLNAFAPLALASVLLAASGCAVTPKQLDSLGQDDGVFFTRTAETPVSHQQRVAEFEKLILQQEPSSASGLSSERADIAPLATSFEHQVITQGDMIRLRVNGMPELDGLYQINSAGQLDLPFSSSLPVSGLSRQQLVETIEDELVQEQWLYRDLAHIDVSIVDLAAVNVSVAGAVFNPGRVSINNRPANRAKDPVAQLAGAFTSGRDLIAALIAAGGVRPDADPSQIFLKRGSNIMQVPLTAVMLGNGFVNTPTLINGDEVLVGSTGIENTAFIKPSAITPPGMRIFMSNLIAPALSNAQGAVGADSTRLPFGTSLLDAAVSANCVGGTHQANASRSVLLITRNYGSTKQLVVKRSINQLLADSSRTAVNPYLMPNDALACYDSRFTNFRDVARGVGELISPILLGRLL